MTAAMKYRAFLAMDSWLSTAVTNSLTARLVAQQIGAKVDRKKHKRHHSRYLSFCAKLMQHCSQAVLNLAESANCRSMSR